MPTRREREYYAMGYRDGVRGAEATLGRPYDPTAPSLIQALEQLEAPKRKRPKRKLSAWNKYVKNKRNHIRYRDGKLNLKENGRSIQTTKRGASDSVGEMV